MSVTKDIKTKTWTAQVWYKDFTGKRKHTTKRGFATKRDAEKWEREFLCDEHPQTLTIGDLAKQFEKHTDLRVSSGSIRDTTASLKKQTIQLYILPYFKYTNINTISTNDVNIWLDKLINSHKGRNGQRLSSGTIKTAKQVLSQMYQYAMTNMGLQKNPVDAANDITFFSTDTRSTWTPQQFIDFHYAIADKFPIVALVLDTIYASGLRIGEVLALTPNDITPYSLSIVKCVVRLPNNGLKIHGPKTKSSKRDVKIPRSLFYELIRYIDSINDIEPTDRIFPITDSTVRRSMNKIEKSLGLPHSSPHMLRHLYASTMYAATKDLTVVASQLGHASIDVTAKVYAHMIAGNDREAVDKLEDVLTIK